MDNIIKNNELNAELLTSFQKHFLSLYRENIRLSHTIGSSNAAAGKLLETYIQKIKLLEDQVSSFIEVSALERDIFGITRERISLCDSISQVVNNLKNHSQSKKTIIENRFPKNPLVVWLHKTLFEKWCGWFVSQLYFAKSIIQITIDVSIFSSKITIRISPKRVSGKIEPLTDETSRILAEHYFTLEGGTVTLHYDGSVEIGLPGYIMEPDQSSDNGNIENVDILYKINEGTELPTLSPIAVKIIELASSETASAQEIAKVVSLDPALTTRLLKVVNSPFYGFANTITSVSQAIAILGMKAVRSLSLCISIFDAFPLSRSTSFDYHLFWEHSLASAVISRLTTRSVGLRDDEEAFIAGLTQNVGSLIFAQFYPERYGKLLKRLSQHGGNQQEMERAVWGIDHATLGYELFMRWKMPLVLTQTILYHHNPEDIPDSNKAVQLLAKIVYLSDSAARVLYESTDGHHLIHLKEQYKTILGVPEDITDAIMEQAGQEIETVAQEFNFAIDRPQNYTELLQFANIELGKINLDYEQMTRALQSEKKRAEKLTKELQEANALLAEEVNTDGLTGLYNHRFFYELLNKEFSNAVRHKHSISCIMLDIDFFKNINDIYGHQEGDVVLESIGKTIKDAIREGDFAARYGGEEFAILLPNTRMKDATMVAERMRTVIEQSSMSQKIKPGGITVSLGVACYNGQPMAKANELVENADKAVYKAKADGRNRVVIYPFSEKL